MPKAEFFIDAYIEGLNKRQKKHWTARSKKDKERQRVWCAMINVRCPPEAFIGKPHRKRQVALCVVRGKLLDYDGLVGGLKPFIDVLRCRRESPAKGLKQILVWEGVLWDDSPRYVDWAISQRLLQDGDALGVHVVVNYELEE